MSENNITIRPETKDDYRAVENLTREAFWNVYRPGCMEHYVLHCYRNDPAFVPELDFVMELNGKLIGQVIYVRSEIDCDDGRKVPIMTFGPIGIAPAYKRQGYGKKLLDYSMEKAKEIGAGALAITGNILFYGKGFRVADISDCGINLMYLPLVPDAEQPKFKECAKHPKTAGEGFVLYYTDQCPFTYYWVPRVSEVAREHGIPLKVIHITDKESAQNVPAPVTTYALFRDGRFLTQSIQSDKKFLALAGVQD